MSHPSAGAGLSRLRTTRLLGVCLAVAVVLAVVAARPLLTLGLKGTGAERRARFTCKLARGVYRYYVEARDLSGNAAQAPLGRNRLTVR